VAMEKDGRVFAHRKLVSHGFYLVVPRTYHLILTIVTTILALLVLIPSWYFFKKAVVFQVGYVSLTLAVAWAMMMQALPRNLPAMRLARPDTTWLRIIGGSDRLIGATALVAAILIACEAGFLIAGLANCSWQTTQGLGELVFGNTTAITDWTTAYRTPEFATRLLVYQMCLDDYAFTIAYVVVALVLLVDLLLVALMQGMARGQTRKLIRELATREVVQIPAERGVRVMDLSTRLEEFIAAQPGAEGLRRRIHQIYLFG
jgi:Na+-transporting methylmalonyl-CoA/oxaloacetate decarboxylase gamma subunit